MELDTQVLVIADGAGPIGIGGVMGGGRTAVSESTVDVLFEMAWFQPAVVGACSRRLGLLT
ncbi:MAG: B3/4 domain-containing protein, partial [Gammaproteobacteria bacterium]|nr:B3/4 domain-containing protein [Gammaproteobacteria bacterium]